MLQRQFSIPVFEKKLFCRETILLPQRFAWNSAGLNSCVIEQGQNDLNFQCWIVYIALVYSSSNMSPIRIRTKWPSGRFTSPQDVLLCVATLQLFLSTLFVPPFCSSFICHRAVQAKISNAINFMDFYFLGESKTQITNLRLNDNNWHKVHLTRNNRALTITIDDGLGFGKLLSHI